VTSWAEPSSSWCRLRPPSCEGCEHTIAGVACPAASRVREVEIPEKIPPEHSVAVAELVVFAWCCCGKLCGWVLVCRWQF